MTDSISRSKLQERLKAQIVATTGIGDMYLFMYCTGRNTLAAQLLIDIQNGEFDNEH